MAEKKQKMSKLKLAGIVLGVLFLIGACGALFADEENVEEEEHEEVDEQEGVVEEEEVEEQEDSVEEIEEEEQAVEEDESEDEVDEEPVEEESEDDVEAEEVTEHEVIDGVDVFTYTETNDWSLDSQMRDFSIAMTDLLSEQHGEIEGDAVFRTLSPVRDDSGNERVIYSAQVYYTQETIDGINFENWPNLVAEDLYNTADSVMIYHPIGGETDVENKIYDGELPDFYMGTIGAEFEG